MCSVEFLSMSFKIRLFLASFTILHFISFPCICQEESASEGPPSEEQELDDIKEQMEDVPYVGPFVKWLFNEDRKYFVMPIISSGPDTGILVGITYYHTDLFGRDKRDMLLGALTTQSGQNNFMFSWVEPGMPLEDGRISLGIFYTENPLGGIRYFGEGNWNNYEDVASNFRATAGGGSLGYIYEFTEHFTLFSFYGFSNHSYDDPDPEFEFDDDEYASRPISEVHPDIFDSEEFQEGYNKGSFSTGLSYDSRERERLLRYGPGMKISGGISWSNGNLGSDYNWLEASAGFSHYIGLDEVGKHLFCYRVHYVHSQGDVPFDQLPSLNSGTNRGYYSGRFRDENKLEGNLEYRFYATKHFGMAFFLDGGRVFESGESYERAIFKQLHPAVGAGVRIKIPPQIIFRIDWGISEEQSNFYFTLGESF
jgi:outer membrane protein assembly factor BamA